MTCHAVSGGRHRAAVSLTLLLAFAVALACVGAFARTAVASSLPTVGRYPPVPIVDVYEPDESAAAARALPADAGVIAASIFPSGDVDWKVFDTVPGRAYSVTVRKASWLPDYADGVVVATVYDANLTALPHPWFVATGSRYYARVVWAPALGGGTAPAGAAPGPIVPADGGDGSTNDIGQYFMQIETVALHAISGRVTGAAGAPLAGVTVRLREDESRAVVTAADGRFTFGELLRGSYTPYTENDQGYLDMAYRSVVADPSGYLAWGDSDPIDVSAGDATGIDFALPRAHAVSGRLTDGAGVPVEGRVSLLSPAGAELAVTGSDPVTGAYVFDRVPPGTYRVQGRALGRLATWFPDAAVVDDPSGAQAQTVVVGAADVIGIDVPLRAGRRVTGTFRADPNPADPRVTFRAWLDNEGIGGASTDLQPGRPFVLAGIDPADTPGPFTLSVGVYVDGVLSYAWEYGSDTLGGEGTPLDLTGGDIQGIPLVGRWSSVAGRVLGDPGPGITTEVWLFREGPTAGSWGEWSDWKETVGGAYDMIVPPGTYRLRADLRQGYSTVFGWWYGDTDLVDDALTLAVPLGRTIAADLHPPNTRIQGTVTGAGAPLAGAQVVVFDVANQRPVGTATSAADGSYVSPPVVPGRDYVLDCYVPEGMWLSQWNGGRTAGIDVPAAMWFADIPPVHVPDAGSVVDFDLVQGGRIGGAASGSVGDVHATNPAGADWTVALTGSSYAFPAVPTGTYRLSIDDGGDAQGWSYPSSPWWYPSTGDESAATWVEVMAGQTTRADFPAPTVPPAVPGYFQDVAPTDQYGPAIDGLAALLVVSGFGDGFSFGPEQYVRRAQFAKMIDGALGLPVPMELGSPFTDLGDDDPADRYPHQYVAVAAREGITVGVTPTTFEPWQNITRAQVVTMIVRGARTVLPGRLVEPPAGYQGTLGSFDREHALTMRVAESNGMLAGLQGFGPGWDPWAPATRGEVSQLLWSLIRPGG